MFVVSCVSQTLSLALLEGIRGTGHRLTYVSPMQIDIAEIPTWTVVDFSIQMQNPQIELRKIKDQLEKGNEFRKILMNNSSTTAKSMCSSLKEMMVLVVSE